MFMLLKKKKKKSIDNFGLMCSAFLPLLDNSGWAILQHFCMHLIIGYLMMYIVPSGSEQEIRIESKGSFISQA